MGYDLAAALTEDREAWGLEFAWTREQPPHRKQTKSDVFTGGSDVGPKGRQSCFCISLPKLGKLVGFRAGCREHFDWITFRMSSRQIPLAPRRHRKLDRHLRLTAVVIRLKGLDSASTSPLVMTFFRHLRMVSEQPRNTTGRLRRNRSRTLLPKPYNLGEGVVGCLLLPRMPVQHKQSCCYRQGPTLMHIMI